MHHDVITPAAGGPSFNLQTFLAWLAGNGYATHRGCFLGDSTWVTAYVAANWVIALAYILVALLIAQRMKRAAHIPRTVMGMALLGIFVTCSIGHFLEGLTTLFWPGYRLETMWHWVTAIPAWLFLANHNKFSLIVEGPHMIAETREELSRKNAELRVLYDQVKETDAVKSTFFANVSHELRTPLTLILGPIRNLLAADNLTPAQRSELELVARNARTVLKHVNDLLDVSRMEAGRMQLSYVQTDLVPLTRVVASLFETVLNERRQTLTLETPDTLIAQVDSDKVERVLLNLVSNAVKFVQPGGAIVCRLRITNDAIHSLTGNRRDVKVSSKAPENETVEIEVQDDGPGIPLELREAVFERFHQVDSSMTRRYEGTGLGLSIVRDFVELHGGDVSVIEAPGGGALFRIRLPRNAPPETEIRTESVDRDPESASFSYWEHMQDRLPVEEQPGAATVSKSDKPLILIVEDNQDMSAFITRILAPAYRTVTAFDGRLGIEHALKLHPDLILSDLMMPNQSGDQMVNTLRTYEELDETPIILLTAKADDDLKIRLLMSGAQDYLTKPFAPEELRARVSNLVSIKRARQALHSEIVNKQLSLESMASEVAARNRALRHTLGEAQAARRTAEEASIRARELQEALSQRNSQLVLAVREVHHRVKNSLQVVTALMELKIDSDQIMCIRPNSTDAPGVTPYTNTDTDTESNTALPVSSIKSLLRQIKSIAVIHNLLEPDSDYNDVDLATVLETMQEFLKLAFPESPSIKTHAESLVVHIKVAFAIALIVNELVELLVNQYSGRSKTVLIQEPAQSDAIHIYLHHDAGNLRDAVLAIEFFGHNIGNASEPDSLFVTGNRGFDLVRSLVQCDLQGNIHFAVSGRNEAHSNALLRTGTAERGRIEIIFPQRPAAV